MLTTADIVKDGHPVLRKVADDVFLPLNDDDKKTLELMMEYVQNSQDPSLASKFGLRPGIGLAAPQINISKKMIAIHVHDENGTLHSYSLVNPKIISHSVEKSYLTSGEGCLSVDEPIQGIVPRYARITVKGYSITGEEIKLRLKGMIAVVFQHEIDHLNGIMFYDHINKQVPLTPPPGAIPIDR